MPKYLTVKLFMNMEMVLPWRLSSVHPKIPLVVGCKQTKAFSHSLDRDCHL